MEKFDQCTRHKHMTVYSSDNSKLGHVHEIYPDSFLVQKRFIFTHDGYVTYNYIQQVKCDAIHLKMTEDEALAKKWTRRLDYKNHLGDPTQLFYDRGHGVHDPFDEKKPHQA